MGGQYSEAGSGQRGLRGYEFPLWADVREWLDIGPYLVKMYKSTGAGLS